MDIGTLFQEQQQFLNIFYLYYCSVQLLHFFFILRMPYFKLIYIYISILVTCCFCHILADSISMMVFFVSAFNNILTHTCEERGNNIDE